MRIEALDQVLPQQVSWLSPGHYAYQVDNQGRAVITGEHGQRWVVTSVEDARKLIASLRKTATGLNRYTSLMTGGPDLSEILKCLDVGSQKLHLLNILPFGDLLQVLALLSHSQLLNGLFLFDRRKLLRLLLSLPKKIVLTMLLRLLSPKKILKRMPFREMMRILYSPRLDSRKLANGFMALRREQPGLFQLFFERTFGAYDFLKLKPYELKQIILQTPKRRFMESLKTMPQKALVPIVTYFVKQDPSLLLRLSDRFMAKLFSEMPKFSLVEASRILPSETLVKLLSQLPQAMMAMAASQIGDKPFEHYLFFNQAALLKMLAKAA